MKAPDLLRSIKRLCEEVRIEKIWNNHGVLTTHLSLQWGGREYNSWGVDSNELVSLSKALMEMVERLHSHIVPNGLKELSPGLSKEFMKTTSGCSAHFSYDEAVSIAENELIERHQIVTSFLTSHSPQYIEDQVFIWNSVNGRFVALAYYPVKGGGYVFGSAASKSKKDAIKKSREEMSSMIMWSSSLENRNVILNKKLPCGPTLIHQENLRLKHLPLFLLKTESAANQFSFIKTLDVELMDPFKEIQGLKVVRSFSEDLQPFSFEPLQTMFVNERAVKLSDICPETSCHVVA